MKFINTIIKNYKNLSINKNDKNHNFYLFIANCMFIIIKLSLMIHFFNIIFFNIT